MYQLRVQEMTLSFMRMLLDSKKHVHIFPFVVWTLQTSVTPCSRSLSRSPEWSRMLFASLQNICRSDFCAHKANQVYQQFAFHMKVGNPYLWES